MKLLSLHKSILKRDNCPSLPGKWPWKLLFLIISKVARKERFSMWGAVVPKSPMSERFKDVTLWCWSVVLVLPQVTPNQLQKCGVENHIARTFWGSSTIIWALKTRRADKMSEVFGHQHGFKAGHSV